MKRIAAALLAAFLAAGAAWTTAVAAPESHYRDVPSLVNATMSAFMRALKYKSMMGFARRFEAASLDA